MNEQEFHDTVVASLATLEAHESATRVQVSQVGDSVARIEKVLIIGNGSPSLVAQVAKLNAQMEERIREAGELRENVGGDKTNVRKESVVTSTAVAAIVVGLLTGIKTVFFPS